MDTNIRHLTDCLALAQNVPDCDAKTRLIKLLTWLLYKQVNYTIQ